MMKDGRQEGEQQLDGLRALLAKAGEHQTPVANGVFAVLTADGNERVAASSHAALRDAAIMESLQLNLHYYIAAYGTLATLATRLGFEDDARNISGMRDHMIAKDGEYTELALRQSQASDNEKRNVE